MSNNVHPIFQSILAAIAPELCEDCEKRPAVAGNTYCQSCIDNAAEAHYERQCENFYGGSEPVTMDEIHRAAWEEKQGLRR